MSANDAPGEANNNNIFGSPNISFATEEEPQIDEAAAKAAEEQKKRETVEIDGIPIAEKDIKFKTANIHKKADINYFINVEGTDEIAEPQDAKTKLLQFVHLEEKPVVAAAAKAQQAQPAKAAPAAAAKKPAAPQKSVQANSKASQQNAQGTQESLERLNIRLDHMFWKGKRKLITIGVIGAILIAIIAVCVFISIGENKRIENALSRLETVNVQTILN